MPERPKPVKRPWIKQIEYNAMQGQGRHVINSFYNTGKWKRLRDMFIKGISYHLGKDPHPNAICIECWRLGRTERTHTIDHIKPINPVNAFDTMNGRYGEPLRWENLQPLCEHHNAVKTGKERHNG